MSPTEGEITHVSDTALMVAAARAVESEAADAFVCDPFAARLAGERGMAMLRALTHPEMLRFGIAIRSRFIDELLLEALAAQPITCVLSVGCGLDTRPWRLDLPAELHWIEVDFADMLDYKEERMAGETPHCRRERLSADLNHPADRQAVYAAAGAAPALMITEGLLMYLPGGTVDAIAAEAGQGSGIAHWISDVTTSAFSRMIGGRAGMSSVQHVQAEGWLHGEEILETVQRHGWSTAARRSYITDMAFAVERIGRMRENLPPTPPPEIPPGDPTGVHRFARV
jgi:methyltransferase (TIGR00027 family)